MKVVVKRKGNGVVALVVDARRGGKAERRPHEEINLQTLR